MNYTERGMMGSTQIYLAVGIPMLTILVAVLVQLVAIFATRSSTEKQIAISFEGLGKRMDAFEDRIRIVYFTSSSWAPADGNSVEDINL